VQEKFSVHQLFFEIISSCSYRIFKQGIGMKSYFFIFLLIISNVVFSEEPAEEPAKEPAMPINDISLAKIDSQNSYVNGSLSALTKRNEYDNQPHFANNNLLYWTRYSDGQTDIWQADLNTGKQSALTKSAESEYSPTLMPGNKEISAIRVAVDGTQRLWSIDLSGQPVEIIIKDLTVGYHSWMDNDTLALFVLGDPMMTLQIAKRSIGKAKVLDADIGRSLHKVPGKSAISYTVHRGEQNEIRIYDLNSFKSKRLVDTMKDSQDYVWLADGSILMGQGNRIFRLQEKQWKLWAEFPELGDITRLAVSPDGKKLALVHGPINEPESK